MQRRSNPNWQLFSTPYPERSAESNTNQDEPGRCLTCRMMLRYAERLRMAERCPYDFFAGSW